MLAQVSRAPRIKRLAREPRPIPAPIRVPNASAGLGKHNDEVVRLGVLLVPRSDWNAEAAAAAAVVVHVNAASRRELRARQRRARGGDVDVRVRVHLRRTQRLPRGQVGELRGVIDVRDGCRRAPVQQRRAVEVREHDAGLIVAAVQNEAIVWREG